MSLTSGFPPRQRVPLSRQLSHTSHAWLTHSVLSSMILPHPSVTSLSPTPSQFQISLLDGTLASAPRPARHSLVNKGTGPAFMSRLSMAPRFQSSGGVCSSVTLPLLCIPLSEPGACRQWYSVVRSGHWGYHLRPSARWQDKLQYFPFVWGNRIGYIR